MTKAVLATKLAGGGHGSLDKGSVTRPVLPMRRSRDCTPAGAQVQGKGEHCLSERAEA